jgi:broad specificity phosphatase PhoE
VQLLLVRHGHAGSKQRWRGDDRLRPLTAQGLAQAQYLAEVLEPFAPGRIISSPYLRCVQTITPLSEVLGLSIEQSKRLIPSASGAAESLARRTTGPDEQPVVLCTHGEVIHHLQVLLGRDTRPLFGRGRPRGKGSVWILERQGRRFSGARYIGPLGPKKS